MCGRMARAMHKSKWRFNFILSAAVPAAVLTLLLPAAIRAQGLAREALSCFPPDTVQLTYTDLAHLRSLPNYSQLSRVLFSRPVQQLEELLQPLGADPEKDVDEVALGWRGPMASNPVFFGLAEGRFHPSHVQDFMTREQLPSRQYEGYLLSTFGSGLNSNDLFFTFLSSDLAAFGSLSDLEALIDGYLGNRVTLDSNSQFVNWEAELEGSGPQWGITTGKAAANLAAPWLASGSKDAKADLNSLFAPIQAVLYQADWSDNFSAQIDVICQTPQSAQTLAQLLTLWRDSASSARSRSPEMTNFIQDLQIDTDGRRVELAGSGPPGVLNQFLSGVTGR